MLRFAWPLSFLGGGPIVKLIAAFVSDSVIGGPSTSKWRIGSDGGIYESRASVSGGAYIKQYDWIQPASEAPNYECTWTAVTNLPDVTPVAAGTWAQCNVNRDWEETNPTAFETCTFTARLRRIGTTNEFTASITLEVDGSP